MTLSVIDRLCRRACHADAGALVGLVVLVGAVGTLSFLAASGVLLAFVGANSACRFKAPLASRRRSPLRPTTRKASASALRPCRSTVALSSAMLLALMMLAAD